MTKKSRLIIPGKPEPLPAQPPVDPNGWNPAVGVMLATTKQGKCAIGVSFGTSPVMLYGDGDAALRDLTLFKMSRPESPADKFTSDLAMKLVKVVDDELKAAVLRGSLQPSMSDEPKPEGEMEH